ncbi:MAG TPA: glycosyltransferase family 4 protein [Chitinophagaceae bacterium]
MHNLTKIKLFRIAAWITYPIALVFIYPFVLLKKKNASHLFFFFDRYAIGGAQRVHLDILKSVEDVHKQVYFTRKSLNTSLKNEFYSIPNTVSKDVHFWCDNLLFRLFSVHYFVFYINRHASAHVFSSNSTFFYDMLPFFNRKVRTTELLHNFTFGKKGMEFFGLANHRHLTNRIVIDAHTLSNIRQQYDSAGLSSYMDRVKLIEPGVMVPPYRRTAFTLPLKVLYAGRGGPQKRIHLLNRIAEHCIKEQLPVEFHFAGTMMDELSPTLKEHSILHGQISSQQKMYELYDHCDVILLTSAYEGFPMIIKEGMACGCVPVVTALEGNKTHLRHGYNALLINEVEDENLVVSIALNHINTLIDDTKLLFNLSKTCHEYAVLNFSLEQFRTAYREFLLN